MCEKCKTSYIVIVPTYFCSVCDGYYYEKYCEGRGVKSFSSIKIKKIHKVSVFLEILIIIMILIMKG